MHPKSEHCVDFTSLIPQGGGAVVDGQLLSLTSVMIRPGGGGAHPGLQRAGPHLEAVRGARGKVAENELAAAHSGEIEGAARLLLCFRRGTAGLGTKNNTKSAGRTTAEYPELTVKHSAAKKEHSTKLTHVRMHKNHKNSMHEP